MTSHYSNEQYHLVNTQLSKDLFQSKYPVRIYQNASFALYDITMGLQQYLSHKNHLAVVKNGSSLTYSLMALWLRQSVPIQLKTEQQSWVEYIETLNPETNFVIWATENEITGEVLISEKEALDIHERLSKKRIFSIQITHQLNPLMPLTSYSILVVRKSIFADNACLVVMTDKMKASSLIGPYQNTNLINTDDFALQKNEASVESIENQLIDKNSLFFNQSALIPPRLADRVVLSYRDVNAYAIQQDLGLSDSVCLAAAKYPFWVLDTWKSWWKDCEKETFIRGLLVVSLNAFQHDILLTEKIQQSVDKIRRLGHWNVLP